MQEVFKPQTDFPLKPRQHEPFTTALCQNIYNQQQEIHTDKPLFTVLDGPPYANGHIHLGHVINKIQKDLLGQLYFMLGHKVSFVPGSDCHGLPIEKNIEKQLKEEAKDPKFNIKKVDPLIIREACKKFANNWIEVQNKEFASLGVFASWNDHFKTMEHAHSILEKFHQFAKAGYIYKGVRPIMWSIAEQTSMATAEVEYKQHESTAIDVKFPVTSSPHLPTDAKVVIWTTTVWTIPANRAIAYNPSIAYLLIKCKNEKLVLCKSLLSKFLARANIEEAECEILEEFPGSKLENTICQHPFYDLGYTFQVPLLPGAHVTEEDGTGCVHTAPAHGEEDFELGIKHGIELTDIVASDGRFQNTPVFSGLSFKQATKAILEELQKSNHLLSENIISHSYPYSWRSHTPLIYKITPQWYLKIDNLKEAGLKIAEQITWLPENSKNRFESMLQGRGDWCISRQRAWGTPLGLFTQDDKPIFDHKILDQTLSYLKEHGMNAWFTDSPEQILGQLAEQYSNAEKTHDILDVWFDAGCMQYCLTESTNTAQNTVPYPADFYLEGSDQHRGFFQACVIINALTKDGKITTNIPAKNILTHGFILDAKGRKMSKSLGNTVSLFDILDTYGVDVVRTWVALTDCTDDIKYSKQQMDKIQIVYNRFRNTIRYLLASLKDFNPQNKKPVSQWNDMLRAVYHKMCDFNQQIIQAPTKYRHFYEELYHFCDSDLSGFLFDINKDTLYCDPMHGHERLCILSLYYDILTNLLMWLTPVMKHTCQEAWEHFNQTDNLEVSNIFIQQFQQLPAANSEHLKFWTECKKIRDAANEQIEPLRANKTINQATQASLQITLPESLHSQFTAKLLQYITLTAQVNCEKGENLHIQAFAFEGTKCQRCRRLFKNIEVVCQRCQNTIQG